MSLPLGTKYYVPQEGSNLFVGASIDGQCSPRLFFSVLNYIYFVCWGGPFSVKVSMWRLENDFREWILFFHHDQISRHSSKYLHPLRHLARPTLSPSLRTNLG